MQLDALIIGQIDGDGLAVGIAVASVIHSVVSGEINIRAGNFLLVFLRHRKLLLKLRNELGVTGQLLGPLLIFDKDESLVRSLDAITGIGVVFNRSDHHVYVVVADIHPAHVTL